MMMLHVLCGVVLYLVEVHFNICSPMYSVEEQKEHWTCAASATLVVVIMVTQESCALIASYIKPLATFFTAILIVPSFTDWSATQHSIG